MTVKVLWSSVTWKGLRDDHVLHHDVRDLRLDLHGFSGQLGEDLLAQQNILGSLQLDMPGLSTCATKKQKSMHAEDVKEGEEHREQGNHLN